jgi:HEAT repeat protein
MNDSIFDLNLPGQSDQVSVNDVYQLIYDLHGDRSVDRDLDTAKLRSLDRDRVIDILSGFLKSSELEDRMFSVEALILIDVHQTMELVLPMLNDPAVEVRNHVCYWLTQDGDERVVEPMIKVLLEDPSPDVRAMAASVLGASMDIRAKPALIQARDNDFAECFLGYTVSGVASSAPENFEEE